jgi:DNA-binding NarL/FixJ family response regulator
MTLESEQRTILLIDDTINNLRVAVDLLRTYGYRILTASNGEDGLARALLARPDLILLDIRMPGIDGLETCRRLKANPETASTPVIFMTALTDTDDKVRGFEVGGVDYVTKPFDAGELLARVRTHLELSDLRLHLIKRVQERTAALTEEVALRKRSQEEQAQLLELLRGQSEQLRQLTRKSLAREEAEAGLAGNVRGHIIPRLEAVRIVLTQMHHLFQSQRAVLDVSIVDNLEGQLAHGLSLQNRALDELRQATAIERQHANSSQNPHNDLLLKLTTREYEVLQLIAQGKSNSEIAEILVVSRSTVSSYRTRIMRKLGIEDAAALLRFVMEQRLAG